MVHLVFGVRRAQRDGHKGWSAWVAGRREQWRGIVFSDVIIAAGFAIFALSDFPPTQRFGLVVLAGTIIDILSNLFVLPLLGARSVEGAIQACCCSFLLTGIVVIWHSLRARETFLVNSVPKWAWIRSLKKIWYLRTLSRYMCRTKKPYPDFAHLYRYCCPIGGLLA